MPVNFVVVRASDIPKSVFDKSDAKAGITGSDIVWNSGLGKDFGETLPFYDILEDATQSSLYVGITQKFRDSLSTDPSLKDLSFRTIATKYRRISEDFCKEKGIEQPTIKEVLGTDEAMQYLYPECVGILGIISTGNTTKANDILVLEQFYDVSLKLISSGKMTRRDKEILDDLREKIAVAVQRKRMI